MRRAGAAARACLRCGQEAKTGGARGRAASYGRGERVAEYSGKRSGRLDSDGRATIGPISGTCPGSEIAQSVQTSSSSSRCRCASATDCPTQNTRAASKIQRCRTRRGPGGAQSSLMRSPSSYSAFRLCMECGQRVKAQGASVAYRVRYNIPFSRKETHMAVESNQIRIKSRLLHSAAADSPRPRATSSPRREKPAGRGIDLELPPASDRRTRMRVSHRTPRR